MGHKRSVLKIDHFDRDSNSKTKNGSKYANGQLQKEAVGRGHLLNRKRGKASGKKGKPRKCTMASVKGQSHLRYRGTAVARRCSSKS